MSVKSLRADGWKVRVRHFRYPTLHSDLTSEHEIRILTEGMGLGWVEAKGGRVEVDALSPSGKEYKAWSQCSKKDNYNRKFGVAKALERLQKEIS